MRARRAVWGIAVYLNCLAAFAEDAPPPPAAFIGTFSNGVRVELVGVGMNPSSKAEWWSPYGSPLSERPYAQVRARLGGETARELCWRWHGINGKDIETNWSTEPGYSGAGGHAVDAAGKQIAGLEAVAVSFDRKVRSCTVRFTITVPISLWTTTISTQAGYSSSTSKLDIGIGRVGAAFLPPRSDGPDTIVPVAYDIPAREVRLVAIDNDGRERIGELITAGSISGVTLGEYRFKNVIRDDLKTWNLQTRVRKPETVEFQNVSLESDQKTEVKVVDAGVQTQITIATNLTPTGTNADSQVAADERYQQQQELVKALAEKHGYQLADGQLLKFIKDPGNEERNQFRDLLMDSMSLGGWRGGQGKRSLEPFMLVFETGSNGTTQWASHREGIITLAEVVEQVLKLRRHQFDCPPNMLFTYMPGDWILSWDPNQPHELSDAAANAFERILNEELHLAVRVRWKSEKRPALVVSGEYKAAPKYIEDMSPEVARRSEGMFEIPARRSDISARAGRPDEFTEAIGEVLMLPVVNEAKTHPTKEGFFWRYSQEPPVAGGERLDPLLEQHVLDSLHDQLGYDLSIEPREVRLLSIGPVAE